MLLSKLFKSAPDIEIEQLSTDSRLPMNNAIFFCLSGIKYDGHLYVEEAVKNGAKVIIYSEELKSKPKAIYIKVKNVQDTLKKIANIFYGYPGNDIETFVISGTNGRASVGKIINHCLNKEIICAYVGILGIQFKDKDFSMSFPTMPPLDNMKALFNLKNEDVHAVTFEATGSALNLKKLDIISPNVFIFTGCDEKSTEYKTSNKEYYNWIRRYLYTLESHTKAVFNADDDSYDELYDSVETSVSYGMSDRCDYQISDINLNNSGIRFNLKYMDNTYPVECGLKGRVNVYNVTAALAALNESGYGLEKFIEYLKDIKDVEGVYQKIGDDYNVIVDCAYDPQNVEEIVKYAKSVNTGRIIAIMGVDYYDDENRFAKVAKILNDNCDIVIFTEDASHEAEVSDVLLRIDKYNTKGKFIKYIYRSSAIENGIDLLNDDDILLILGKGDEDFLTMGLGREFYYGDAYYALKYIRKRKEKEYETE